MATQTMQSADDMLVELETALRRPLRQAALVSVVSSLLWPVQAYLAAHLIGGLIAGTASAFEAGTAAVSFGFLGFVRHMLDATAGGRAFKAAQAVVRGQRLAMTERAARISPISAEPPPSAAMATLLGNKMELILAWATRYKMAETRVRMLPFGIISIVLVQSWAAALLLFMCGPLIPVFMALIGFAARDASEKHLAEQGTLNAGLLEWLNAGPDIRILAAEERTRGRFEAAAETLKQKTMAVLRIAFLSSTVLEFFSALGIALVAVYVGFSLLGVFSFGTYSRALSITSGIFILLMTPDFFQPLRELAAAWHDRAAAQALAAEIGGYRRRSAETIFGRGETASPLTGPIRIETAGLAVALPTGATISYPDLLMTAGEKIAVVGPSGVGKSTLLGLMAGLARPAAGVVTVCGHPLDDTTADRWRMRLTHVGQTPHMLNASVAANLSISSASASRQDIEQALDTAAAAEVVARLPRGLREKLGENGAGVSGGEARRLVIARAVLSGADLILADEPTADLDAETAAIVTDALIRASEGGRTLIVATHDPVLAARMDRIVELRSDA